MELRNVLNQLKSASGASMQKTASAEIPKTSAAQNELFQALNTALAAADKTASSQTKTASATDELTKIAQNLAAADQESLVKEAQLYGACIMDGFVARGMQYNSSLPPVEKTAAAQPTQDELAAYAQANPAEFEKFAAAGYADTQRQLEFEKFASTPAGQEVVGSYNQGYHNTVAQVEKLASTAEGQDKLASFQQGYVDTVAQMQSIAASPGGQEKLASMQQGYIEGTELVTKLASDYYTRGFNDTVCLLQNM
jgi:hypothetical protein